MLSLSGMKEYMIYPYDMNAREYKGGVKMILKTNSGICSVSSTALINGIPDDWNV